MMIAFILYLFNISGVNSSWIVMSHILSKVLFANIKTEINSRFQYSRKEIQTSSF